MATTGDSNTFLLFSDVHFDPFADPSLLPELVSSDESAWKSILSSSSKTADATYGHNTNYSLFESALDDMAARAGNVSTIIYPGDILSQDFGKEYSLLTGDTSQAGIDSFIQKTVQFFAQEVDSRFPGATVIVADGNADSALGAVGSSPGDPYLAISAPILSQAFFNNDTDRSAFATSYSLGGYYAVEPDGPTGLKYISLNDNLWASQNGDSAAGVVELSWFASQLAASAQDFQKVYVVTHIPVGNATSSGESASPQTGQASYSGYLENSFNNAFVGLELAYDSTIAATFAGHTHNDDFRLMTAEDGSGASALMRIAPAISPIFGNNPGYQVYSYDPQTFSLVDETTYNLDLQATTPTWGEEYDYAQTYGQTLATPQQWQATYAEILTNPVTQAAYFDAKTQGASGQSSLTAASAASSLLSIGATTPASFNAASALLAG